MSFNPSGVTLDPYSQVSLAENSVGNIAEVIDIPSDIVQKRLNAIGEELNLTIPSVIIPNEDTGIIGDSLSIHPSPKIEDPSEKLNQDDLHQHTVQGAVKRRGNERSLLKVGDIPLTGSKKNETENRSEYISSKNETRGSFEAGDTHGENLSKMESSEGFNTDDCGRGKRRGIEGSEAVKGSNQITESKENEGNFNTMDTLMQSFIEGKLRFEEFCQLSADVVEREETSSGRGRVSRKEVHIEEIEELEREAKAAAKGLRASKDILCKLDVVMQETQRTDSGKKNVTGTKDDNSLVNSRSLKPGTSQMSLKQDWNQVLFQFRNAHNTEALLQFVENVHPEDITEEMIEAVIDCISGEERNAEKYALDTKKRARNNNSTGDRSLRMDYRAWSFDRRNSIDTAEFLRGSCVDRQKMKDLTHSPRLHIDLRGLGYVVCFMLSLSTTWICNFKGLLHIFLYV